MVQKKRGSNRAQRSSRSLQQPNLWVILSVALLVVGLTVITSLGPSSVTGNTVQKIGRMNKGDSLHLSVRDVPGLEKIITNAGETILYGQIDVDVDESIPFDRSYVSKFTVRSENKFGPLQFTFKVKEQDLLDQGVSRGDLRLYNELQEYSLQLLKVDHGYLYYIVTVPSMGHFVLGRVEVDEKEVVEEETVVEAPVVEEKPAEVAVEEETPEEEPLVGKAAEQSASEMEKGFFAKIAAFFRNLFS
ncbi:MAG: hypothetical protein Q8R47_05125 [Nanoarchaeota archaeon]|nr:hypothetical protein [Nanoarchaeota archaeon]